jgi:hypothetical protein
MNFQKFWDMVEEHPEILRMVWPWDKMNEGVFKTLPILFARMVDRKAIEEITRIEIFPWEDLILSQDNLCLSVKNYDSGTMAELNLTISVYWHRSGEESFVHEENPDDQKGLAVSIKELKDNGGKIDAIVLNVTIEAGGLSGPHISLEGSLEAFLNRGRGCSYYIFYPPEDL